MTSAPDKRCGTYAGVSRHYQLGEPVCDDCREAGRQYMRDYRARRGPARDRWWNNTRSAALELLAAECPERFGELLAQVRAVRPCGTGAT